MEKHDFLKPSIKQIKKSIRDINDSYNNEWDILAELCQNSVDAIKQKGGSGVISLTVNAQDRSITISDDGCGIDPDRMPSLLAPFSTDKEMNDDSIGEKGVGLTFVIFSCNNFHINSSNGQSGSEGTILDANTWRDSNSEDVVQLNHSSLEGAASSGTLVTLKEISAEYLFQLSFNQLIYVLRSRTALGNTNNIWEKDIKIDITLTHISQDGDKNTSNLDYKYYLPTEGFTKSTVVSIPEFINYIKTDKTDKQKRDKLFGKIIVNQGTFQHNGRNIKHWSCFVPTRKSWAEISIKRRLCSQEQFENQEWLDENIYTIFQPGIFVSVKGMPTGIHINNPVTGSQSYWAQIFILFDDKHIKFDIGRKSLPGRQSEIYKKKAREVFNEYAKLFKYVGRKEIDTNKGWEKNEIFAEIEKELDLNNSNSTFLKVPTKQEASVAGIFFECIGSKIIKDIIPLSSGYKGKYDLYAKWGQRQIVIEFKSKLKNIISDFNDEQKMFDELDCIVCWNIDEEDEREFKKKNIVLEDIDRSELGSSTVEFPNATHKLVLSFVDPIYIIDLKVILSKGI